MKKNFYKLGRLSLLGLGLTLFSTNGIASGKGVVSPVIVTGASVGNGSYNTVKEAFDAINGGLQKFTDEITIALNSSVTESAPAVLDSGQWKSVKIYPTLSGVVVSGNVTGALICLNGADNVTIDGRVNGAGVKDLVIDNAATGASQSILLKNEANNNVIKYATIKGANSTANNGVIHIGASISTGNDKNTIDYCDITSSTSAALTGVYVSATAVTSASDSTVISNCNLSNFNASAAGNVYAICVGANTTKTVVNRNQVYWTSSLSPAVAIVYYGIYVKGESNVITNNKIGATDYTTGWSVTSTSTPRIVAILTNGGPSSLTATNISGNIVSGISLNTFSGGDNVNVGYGMLTGIGVDNTYPTTNTAARTYVNIENNQVNNLALLTNAGPSQNTYWNAIGITCNAHYTTIKGNTVHTISSIAAANNSGNKQAVRGINAVNGSVYGATISGNTIYNLTAGDISATSAAANQITALSCSSLLTEGSGSVVEKNLVYNIKALNSANTGVVYAIQTYNNQTAASKDIIVRNNMVRIGTDISCNSSFFGYYPQDHGSGTTANTSRIYFYNNSIYVGGTAKDNSVATGNTACIYRKISRISAIMDFKNNILVNKRSGGITGVHAAILLAGATDYTTSPQWLTSNNNLFDLDAAAFVGAVVASNTAAPTISFASLDLWNNSLTDTPAGTTYDVNSVSGDAMFVKAAGGVNGDEVPNLHISKNSIAVGAAADLTSFVAEDFDGDNRKTATKFVIGADVPDLSTEIAPASSSKSGVYAVGKTIFFASVAGGASVLDAAGALVAQVSAVEVANGSANLSALKSGLYVVVVNGKATKVVLK